MAEDAVVGYVAAAEHGHVVDATIALGYLPVEAASPGTALLVEILGERRPARVVRAPLFNPENARAPRLADGRPPATSFRRGRAWEDVAELAHLCDRWYAGF